MVVIGAGCASGRAAGPSSDPFEAGRAVYSVACATCHGGNGDGGAGPALGGVIETFAVCADHIAWIRLGSDRYHREAGPTYGDTATAITGGMPSFEASLTPDEIARVAAYERLRFAGADPEETLRDCAVG